jgi:hypothetical protein
VRAAQPSGVSRRTLAVVPSARERTVRSTIRALTRAAVTLGASLCGAGGCDPPPHDARATATTSGAYARTTATRSPLHA